MEHILKLQPKYFDFIDYGTKRIELRLYDEKRQKINVGDTILFQKEPELEKTLRVKVVGLLRYNSFEELFNDFDISMLADSSMTKKELLTVLEEFYTPEKQKTYGVVGIRIENERYHHEIYLSDPRKCDVSKLKTVIRHPIKKI